MARSPSGRPQLRTSAGEHFTNIEVAALAERVELLEAAFRDLAGAVIQMREQRGEPVGAHGGISHMEGSPSRPSGPDDSHRSVWTGQTWAQVGPVGGSEQQSLTTCVAAFLAADLAGRVVAGAGVPLLRRIGRAKNLSGYNVPAFFLPGSGIIPVPSHLIDKPASPIDSQALQELQADAAKLAKGLEALNLHLLDALHVQPDVDGNLKLRAEGLGRKVAIHPLSPVVASHGGLAGAAARGEAAKLEWINSGEVVPAKTLATAWNLTPQALGPAAERGEVFALLVKRHRYYPKEFLELDREVVAAVCRELRGLDPSEQFVFWKRPHGALGGKTVLQTLTAAASAGGSLDRVVQLARALTAQQKADADQDA